MVGVGGRGGGKGVGYFLFPIRLAKVTAVPTRVRTGQKKNSVKNSVTPTTDQVLLIFFRGCFYADSK